ncbi:MAG: hypothetical protein NTU83_08215 [Candidatus Hydrogenedentes bacterium]|nr:hypothetical protein [Candidatus Hydrogenedentota bacterium]
MCENGYISIARGGGKAFDKDGKQVKQYKGTGGAGHDVNFIDAVRQGSNKSLAAEIEVGHMSTTLCHQANIAWRVGKATPVEELRENVKQNEDALNTLESMLAQLQANEVDLKAKPFIVGPKLSYDLKTETFTGSHAEEANALIKRQCREPFIIPEKI